MVRSLAKIVLVVTILLVVVPSTQAAQSRVEDRSAWSGARALMSWSFLSDLWEIFSPAWGDNGCWVDPNGGCHGSARGDNGCWVDPSGGCYGFVGNDNGCILDPSGGCRDSAWGDNGCILDPNGGCRG